MKIADVRSESEVLFLQKRCGTYVNKFDTIREYKEQYVNGHNWIIVNSRGMCTLVPARFPFFVRG